MSQSEVRFEIRKKEFPQRRVKDSKGILIQVLLKQLNSYIFRQILSFNVIMTSSKKLKKMILAASSSQERMTYHMTTLDDFGGKWSL